MLFGECKIIAEEEIPEVMAINDQLIIWVSDAEKELADLRTRIAELEKENERSKEELALVQDHFQVTHSINVGLNNENVHLQARIAELEVENARLQKAVEEAEIAITFYADGFEIYETESLPVNDIPIGSSEISGGEAYDDNGFIAKQWLKEYGKEKK